METTSLFYFKKNMSLTSTKLLKSIDLCNYERCTRDIGFTDSSTENIFNYFYLKIIPKNVYSYLISLKKDYFFFFIFLMVWDLDYWFKFWVVSKSARFILRLHFLDSAVFLLNNNNTSMYYKNILLQKNSVIPYILPYLELFKRYPFKQFYLLLFLLELHKNSIAHTWDQDRVKKLVLDFIEKYIFLPKKALSFYVKQIGLIRYSKQKIFIKKK